MTAAAPTGIPALGDPIAEGRVAQVFAWDKDRVVKLARDWVPEVWMAQEFRIARLVHTTGIDMPEPLEMVRTENRSGIVYSRIPGHTMLDRLTVSPLKARFYGRMLGQLQAEMHTLSGPAGLPAVQDTLQQSIASVDGAPGAYKQAAKEMLVDLPEGDALLHGDFHPGNIILAASRPVIIDWPVAASGHPLADVARTVILIGLAGLPTRPVERARVRLLRAAFRSAYYGGYFIRSPYRRSDLAPWLFPVLFARLAEGIESERERTRRWLARLRPDLEP